MTNYDIIFAPVITEKTAGMEADGKYVFKVDVRATKPQIKKAIEEFFNVKVEKYSPKKQKSGKIYW